MGPSQAILRAALWAGSVLLAVSPALAAPYVAGNCIFVATPATEDPFVADDASASLRRQRQGAVDPPTRETDLGFGIDQRVTENFGLSLGGSYTILDIAGQPSVYGFANLSGAVKYQFYKSDEHELLLSLGVIREFGGTGATRVGADSVGTTTPTFYFGKGMGDLSDSLAYLRPLAVTGTLGYQRADRPGPARPDQLVLGLAIEYSLRYLQGNVRYLGLPTVIGRLTPLVEFAFATPASRAAGAATTLTVAPGVVYSDRGIDFAVEVLLPATRPSGGDVGFIAMLHVPFDRFAASWGPLFGPR
jgi:hypothetical protein